MELYCLANRKLSQIKEDPFRLENEIRGQLEFWIKDSYKLARDVSKTGHWGNGDYELTLKSPSNFINLILLIKQSYKTLK